MGSREKKKQKMMQKSHSRKSTGKGKKDVDERKDRMITDDRFASAQTDPRFMDAPKKRSKVSIDSRFRGVFTDRRFTSSNAPIDKRGKPNNNKKASASLEHYYRLRRQDDEKEKSSLEEEEALGDSDSARSDELGGHSETESEKSKESLEEGDSDDDQSMDESSSTSTSDSDEQSVDEEEEDTFMQPEDVPEIDKETRRLAVVNLDWSQVRAVDLYVLLSSFLPKGGQIFSVTVYPSEFGLKRMAEEAVHGPVGLFGEEGSDDGEDDDDIDNKKLRAYELSKLKYYYAVVECDSSATADYVYKNCDGLEFERSANKLDLRFIPDSMDFKHQPRDAATEAPADYEGLDFQTRALQHSNVHLTWDEDEPQRAKTLKRKLTEEQLGELELKEILASDESETDDDKKVDKYRALIGSGNASGEEHEGNSDQDMEVTFHSELENISKRILEKKDNKSETVWEALLRKRKEKRKASKNRSKSSSEDDSDTDQEELAEEADDFFLTEPLATESKADPVKRIKRSKTNQETTQEDAEASRAELELLLAADDQGPDTNLKGYNLKPKKGKGKKANGIPDAGKIPTASYEDPRFSALFNSSLFALDPTDPQFKRSATYARQIAQKQKQGNLENVEQRNDLEIPGEASRHKDGNEESDRMPKRMEKNELSSLVKSIKMKSKQVTSQSRGKKQR